MQNEALSSSTEFLKRTKLYSLYALSRRKYENYFSWQGVWTRKWHEMCSKKDPILELDKRYTLGKQISHATSEKARMIVKALKEHGYIVLNLHELTDEADEILGFCRNRFDQFLDEHSRTNQYPDWARAWDYFGRVMSYELYQHDENDILMNFARNPLLLEAASLYFGVIPVFEKINLIYHPVHQPPMFGSQLWHRDTAHKGNFRIFFSPSDIGEENGPFEFFPRKYSTLKFQKYFPNGMTDEQLLASGLDPKSSIKFVAKPQKGQVIILDTEACLHRGGFTQQPRELVDFSYVTPEYCFSKNKFHKSFHFDCQFNQYKKLNHYILHEARQWMKHKLLY